MNNELLKEYIQKVLHEDYYWMSKKNSIASLKKKSSFLDKIKNFFLGKNELKEFVNDWIEDHSVLYDIYFSNEMKEEILNFVRKKYPLAMKRTEGNEEKSLNLLRKSLDIKFEKQFKELSRKNRLDDEEDL